ncbi:Probable transcriptional regulator [Flavobacterium indicum GPTSA100-9 = DSM 17447]|uniref:Probable transcriptional regulator n=1 Tax=Flavobacterium indicum (strain DSM 17447 / CIP 109464 / GPTSA100-9) TaxID=1094466 RepID=H8XNJ8_FLAIG|nr:helix-turn-helix transcriptional regulator [Flavobacterium indicum]CCG52115.1 Probable transcriptional regulator [Flavobacterium indicum GPTSA100-9 = DSM 17447]
MDKEQELQKFGKKIKDIRELKGLTQAQLAHKINKDRESIARLERGGINPTYLYLMEVCEGLEITMEELMKSNNFEL